MLIACQKKRSGSVKSASRHLLPEGAEAVSRSASCRKFARRRPVLISCQKNRGAVWQECLPLEYLLADGTETVSRSGSCRKICQTTSHVSFLSENLRRQLRQGRLLSEDEQASCQNAPRQCRELLLRWKFYQATSCANFLSEQMQWLCEGYIWARLCKKIDDQAVCLEVFLVRRSFCPGDILRRFFLSEKTRWLRQDCFRGASLPESAQTVF